MKQIILLSLSLLCISHLFSQNQEIEALVNQGIQHHDQGEYEKAISKYEEALEIDPESALANYEIAFTYYNIGEYKKAIEHCEKVLKTDENHLQAYIILGSCYDEIGKAKTSIKIYNKGIKEFPDHYLLHFNKAISYFGMKKYDKSEKEALLAIDNNITHTSSYLLLGNIFDIQNERVKALMSYYFFLFLEPDSKRSPTALNSVMKLLYQGVEQTSDSDINISINPASIKDDEFGSADIMLSVNSATRYIKENDTLSDAEFFVKINKDFFTMLDELKEENKKDNFYWNFYVSFFTDINTSGHTEAFCYYIMQSSDSQDVEDWMLDNSSKIQDMFEWIKE